MKLFDGGRAPNPRRVQIFIREKNIDIERQQLDINAGEPKSEWFTKINPLQTVPVLQLDDGRAIAETMAICRYLEALHPEPNLFGNTPIGIATVEMWQRRCELNLLLPVAQAFRHLHPGARSIEPLQIPEWGELNKGRVVKMLGVLDTHLAESRNIAGEAFSIADITAFVACQFMKVARIQMPEEARHLRRWFGDVADRPSTAFDD